MGSHVFDKHEPIEAIFRIPMFLQQCLAMLGLQGGKLQILVLFPFEDKPHRPITEMTNSIKEHHCIFLILFQTDLFISKEFRTGQIFSCA